MKTALITGTSRGIGFETMKVFLKNGWRVIGTSTTGETEFKHDNYRILRLDLGDRSSIDQLVSKLKDDGVTIDFLDNNAATSTGRGTRRDSGVNTSDLERLLHANVINTIYLTESIKPLLNDNAIIVNISSEFGSLTEDWGYIAPEYRIAKVAINMYTRNLYKDADILKKGVKVYSFDPGWVKTDMGGPDAPGLPEEPAQGIYDLVVSGNDSGLFYRNTTVRDW